MLDHLVFKKVAINEKSNVEEEKEDEIPDAYTYIQIKVKKYFMNGEENCLIQMIDETKNIMC
jgi:hypothetical protein